MAQRTIVHLEDDLDGSEASETVRFGLDGREYEIDLNEGHAEELRSALARFIDAGQSTGKGREKTAKSSPKRSGSNAKEIRAWAKENNIAVNSRGRINEEIVAKYNAAHQ